MINLLIPIRPTDKNYDDILDMKKDEIIYALKNYIPEQVIGYPVTYTGKCPNCKKEVKRTDRYCSRCGKALKHISC